jgi:Flp pilus assembly protein TadG
MTAKQLGSRTFALRRMTARAAREDGGSMVEMALSMSILCSVIFGILAVSLALYSYVFVSNAAREATRYAIVRGDDQAADCGATPGYANCIAQTADIQKYIRNGAFPGIKSSNVTVTTTWLTPGGAACGTTDTCKTNEAIVKSTVSYSFTLAIPFIPARSLTESSTSQMVISY